MATYQVVRHIETSSPNDNILCYIPLSEEFASEAEAQEVATHFELIENVRILVKN